MDQGHSFDAVAVQPPVRPVDEKDRTIIRHMTDREIAEETLAIQRGTQDLIERFIADFAAGKIGGPLALFGKMMGKSS